MEQEAEKNEMGYKRRFELLHDEYIQSERYASELEEENESLKEQLEQYERFGEVTTGLGVIRWNCDNLLLRQKIETFMDELKTMFP